MVAIPGGQREISNLDLMRVSGGFLTVFSVVGTPLVLFVLPGYSIVVAFEMLILFVLFIVGMAILIAGEVARWRKNRTVTRR